MESYDRNGVRAARGRIDEQLLGALLAEPCYALQPPKSTGKELFHLPYLRALLDEQQRRGSRHQVAPDDLIATLTELTAGTVAGACRGRGITELVCSGGGTANPVLMTRLAAALGAAEPAAKPQQRVQLTSVASYGIAPQAKEAFCFALIGSSAGMACRGPPAPPPVPGTRRCSARSPRGSPRCGYRRRPAYARLVVDQPG